MPEFDADPSLLSGWQPPLPADRLAQPGLHLDLSDANPALQDVAVDDPTAFGDWIRTQTNAAGCNWAVGGYAEDRAIYAMSPLFADGQYTRSVHLGVDFWLPAGTPVFAARAGRVHSLGNNAQFGDYGPTILLAHDAADEPLHTLYGHLALDSLQLTPPGQRVEAGQQIGWLGAPSVNVGWPPHLHFQLIRDIGEHQGDFPGVCHATETARWLPRCPDPMPLVRQWCPRLKQPV